MSGERFAVPTCKRGDMEGPEKPTLKRLAELNGQPPWELEVPYPDILPDEAIDFIGSVRMGGVRFARAGERDKALGGD